MDVLGRIEELRRARGWTLYRLSGMAGIPQSTLVNMFNRGTLPSITTLECICSAFGITLSEFFKEEAESYDEPIALYARLSPSARRAVCEIMRELVRNSDENPRKEHHPEGR